MPESEELQDEILSIDAIYPDSIIKLRDSVYDLTIPSHPYLTVTLSFPVAYPASLAPKIMSLSSTNSGKFEPDLATINDILEGRFYEGGVCLFDFIEEMREVFPVEEDHEPSVEEAHDIQEITQSLQDTDIQDTEKDDSDLESESHLEEDYEYNEEEILELYKNYEKTSQGNSTEGNDNVERDIFEGWCASTVISDRKSHFIARVARVNSVEQAQEMCERLKQDKKIAKAAHNMTAWRIKRDDGITFQDYDDDGEAAAGSRLLHLLTVMGLWNVVVFVTRWFGGVHLGPDRFRHISNCAREALELSDLMDDDSSSSKNSGKKIKKLK